MTDSKADPRRYRASRSTTARSTIDRFSPIEPRLRIQAAFDYAAAGLPCPADAYLAALESEDSKRNMGYALDIFAAFLSGGTFGRGQIPWHQLNAEHRDAVRGHLVERYQERISRGRRRANPVSVNNRLAAWRGVLRHAWDKGLMTTDEFQRVAKAPHLPGRREPKRRFVAEDALARIFRCCALDPNGAAGARDAALIALYFGCGMRRFEALSLFLGDIDMRQDGWIVTVIGKRNKERTLGIPIGAAGFIHRWLEHRGWQPGPLFCPIRKSGVLVPQPQPMTTKVGNNIVERRLLAAGVPRFSPHDLRATSTTILAGLLDLFQTMDWAGHEDANTTRGYVVQATNRAQEIAAKLHVPHFSDSGALIQLRWRDLQPPQG
jgi:integrase